MTENENVALAKTSRSLNPVIDLAAGALAGAASVITGHPFDTVKVRLQVQSYKAPVYRGALDCFVKVFRFEGVRGLFKGVTPPTAGEAINNLAIFGIYGQLQRVLQKDPNAPLTLWQTFLSGVYIGALVPFVACPLELIKIRLQNQTEALGQGLYKGPIDCARKVFKEGGIRAMYRGIVPTLLRDIPSYGIYLLSYEWVKALITPKNAEPNILAFIPAGALAGIMCWAPLYPLDVIKTRLQTNNEFKGTIDCTLAIYRVEGWQRFFSGIWPTLVRSVPANVALFVVYEIVLKLGNKLWELRAP